CRHGADAPNSRFWDRPRFSRSPPRYEAGWPRLFLHRRRKRDESSRDQTFFALIKPNLAEHELLEEPTESFSIKLSYGSGSVILAAKDQDLILVGIDVIEQVWRMR